MPSAPPCVPTTVAGIPQNEQEWFEAAAQAGWKPLRHSNVSFIISEYKPFLSRLGGADHSNLVYNKNISDRENLIIADTRERNNTKLN